MNNARFNSIAPCATVPLTRRIALLRADIAAAREKEHRLRTSIATRETTLHRLQAHLVQGDELGAAHSGHG